MGAMDEWANDAPRRSWCLPKLAVLAVLVGLLARITTRIGRRGGDRRG